MTKTLIRIHNVARSKIVSARGGPRAGYFFRSAREIERAKGYSGLSMLSDLESIK